MTIIGLCYRQNFRHGLQATHS